MRFVRPRGQCPSQRGMTLVELIVGTLLLVGGGGGLLLGMQYAMVHVDYLTSSQTAMNTVQGRLEQLSANTFAALWENGIAGGTFGQARTSQQPEPLAALQDGTLTVQIRPIVLPPNTTPTVLELHVAACWQVRGRLIGERVGGACGDDSDANWWVDSPAMVSTRIAMRD